MRAFAWFALLTVLPSGCASKTEPNKSDSKTESGIVDSKTVKKSAISAVFDVRMAERANVVLRVRCADLGEGSKFYWQTVRIMAAIKNETNFSFDDEIDVAHLFEVKGIPMGTSTIYLKPYADLGKNLWQLSGVSHHISRPTQPGR